MPFSLKATSFKKLLFVSIRAAAGVDRVCALGGSPGLSEEEPWIK